MSSEQPSLFDQLTPSASMLPFSKMANSSGSASRLAFTDSARPLMYWRRGRVARVLGSTMTSLGCQKEPTMFFVSPRSTAVLPPMEESIIERVVVGQLMKSMPRI